MADLLYDLIVYPIEYLIEFVFTLAYQMIGSLGYSILAVSLVISFLVLPMYRRSDEIQEEERRQQERMSFWVSHIRRGFGGDERTMLLTEYYRQCGYRPFYALRGSVSLLLQVPFFLAAYHFLSHLTVLRGQSFHFIRDLGAPDALLSFGPFAVNVLPILMTAINILSGAVYTRGYPLRQKAQLYAMALVFLVLLYGSPSGLVLYWTMNNLFSLGKNIFMKRLRNPGRVFAWGAFASGLLFAAFMWLRGKLYSSDIVVFTALVALVCALPLLLRGIRGLRGGRALAPAADPGPSGGEHLWLYLLASAALTLLLGGMVPLTVIGSSPYDFMPLGELDDPMALVRSTLAVMAGFFLVWNSVAWYLMDGRWRRRWAGILCCGLAVALLNYFTVRAGTYLSELMFIYAYSGYGREQILWNLFWTVLVLAGMVMLLRRALRDPRKAAPSRRGLRFALGVLLLAMAAFCVRSALVTRARIDALVFDGESRESLEQDPPFRFSRDGKNVVVIMLDKAVNRLVPYLMEERPELAEQFEGFVYYPNTLSFGVYTNYGMPSIFGGYDYTPAAIDARPELSLEEKHNESLKLMPRLFAEAGHGVTVCDPTYAGYQDIPDLSIYDDIPGIRAFNTDGAYVETYQDSIDAYHATQRHHLVGYCIYRALPAAARNWFFDAGDYRGVERFCRGTIWMTFLKHYSSLEHMADMTQVAEGDETKLMLYVNQTTHDPEVLKLPEYEPAPYVDNEEEVAALQIVQDGVLSFDHEDNVNTYEANMASLLKLGAWFDHLRAEGVYDNTRIILVSDHGKADGIFTDTELDNGVDAQAFNPLLLVKDFGAKGAPATSDAFMTNADVPSLAMEGVIRDPVNPYTGRPVDRGRKEAPLQVTTAVNSMIENNHGNTFDTREAEWYTVTPGDLYDAGNWRRTEEDAVGEARLLDRGVER